MSQSILILDDDDRLRKAIADGFRFKKYIVTEKSDAQNLNEGFDFAVVDLRLIEESGLDAIEKLMLLNPKCRIVMLTGYGSISTAVEAVKRGAINYFKKPASIALIESALKGENINEQNAESEIQTLSENETNYIHFVLNQNHGNISKTAKQLGLHRQSLQRKLKKFT